MEGLSVFIFLFFVLIVLTATALSMFPLIQWLTDLAMFVVVAYTSQQNKESAPGVRWREMERMSIECRNDVFVRKTRPLSPLISVTRVAKKNDCGWEF